MVPVKQGPELTKHYIFTFDDFLTLPVSIGLNGDPEHHASAGTAINNIRWHVHLRLA
jgi:hypothetical protein